MNTKLKSYEEAPPHLKMETILHITFGKQGDWWEYFDTLYGDGNLKLRILFTRMN